MLFTISSKHVEITEALRNHIQNKTSKLPKYYNSINQIEVVIDGGPSSNINIEIIARAEHSRVFVVTEIGDDAYKCIDIAVHKLENQLRRKKGRERDNKHKGAQKPV